MTTMPESHLGMEPSKVFNIEYDHEALMGGDRKIVTTVFGKYYHNESIGNANRLATLRIQLAEAQKETQEVADDYQDLGKKFD